MSTVHESHVCDHELRLFYPDISAHATDMKFSQSTHSILKIIPLPDQWHIHTKPTNDTESRAASRGNLMARHGSFLVQNIMNVYRLYKISAHTSSRTVRCNHNE